MNDVTDKHRKFLVALKQLMHDHQVDLVLKESYNDFNAVELCVVSDGVFNTISSIRYVMKVDDYVYLKL